MSRALTTRRKKVIARELHQGSFGGTSPGTAPRGHVWYLTLSCGHHVWRLDSQTGGKQKTADCWNCPPTVRKP
jgi:hypothetical protein